ASISGIEILSQLAGADPTTLTTPPIGGPTNITIPTVPTVPTNPTTPIQPPTTVTAPTIPTLPTVPTTTDAASPLAIRVHAGGGQYTDPQGVVWAADYGFLGFSSTFSTGAEVLGTNSKPLYQTERWGSNFSYKFAVPNGNYTVNLKFAEIYWTTAGQRLFSVAINNQWVLGNFDILAQAGGPNRALDKSFNVTANAGFITIQFTASADNAKIDAIEILPQNGAPVLQTTTQPTTPTQSTTNPVTVSLSPSFATLNAGASTQFTATVAGPGNNKVNWSVTPAIGTISSTGLYVAPATISSSRTLTIIVTSQADPTKAASASVSLVAPPPTITP